jgi:hypothetical protein
MKPLEWIKNNKLATVLILILLYFVFFRNHLRFPMPFANRNGMETFTYSTAPGVGPEEIRGGMVVNMMGSAGKAMPTMAGDMFYQADSVSLSPSSARMVVTENYISLQVSDVSGSIADIKSQAESVGGFMVSSNVSKPAESASGSITIRIPKDRAGALLDQIKGTAVKVVTEDIQGTDITDQYRDTESRLATLTKNKARLEAIMDDAKDVNQILQVQQQLFMLQDQIDSLIGQQAYLKNTSENVKITIYLSTDEFALPYVPDTSWRPQAVFKEAVRSLVMDFRSLGNRLIWIAVYAVIWIPIILIAVAVYKAWKTKKVTASAPKKKA